MKNATKSLLGAGAVTGAAAAAAYYFYGSKNAQKNRKQVSAWARSAEKEIVQRAKQIKNAALTDATIRGVISEVAKRYEATRNIDPKDIRDFVGTMQEGFREAKKSVQKRLAGRAGGKAKAKKRAPKGRQKKEA